MLDAVFVVGGLFSFGWDFLERLPFPFPFFLGGVVHADMNFSTSSVLCSESSHSISTFFLGPLVLRVWMLLSSIEFAVIFEVMSSA